MNEPEFFTSHMAYDIELVWHAEVFTCKTKRFLSLVVFAKLERYAGDIVRLHVSIIHVTRSKVNPPKRVLLFTCYYSLESHRTFGLATVYHHSRLPLSLLVWVMIFNLYK